MPISPEMQEYSKQILAEMVPEIERIIETYKSSPEDGLSMYLAFAKRFKPHLVKIVKSIKDPYIPVLLGLMDQKHEKDVEEVMLSSNLFTALQVGYRGAKGLEGDQFMGTTLHHESMKTQDDETISRIPPLVEIVKDEVLSDKI